MIIAVDFDGTCVKHRYPMVGEDVDGAVSVLKELVRKGHKIILYTMRSGDTLDDAISWFIDNDIELWGINRNPEQYGWSSSPKVFANLYIDDAALVFVESLLLREVSIVENIKNIWRKDNAKDNYMPRNTK